MGYLDNSSVTVDAILTNKGRQILAAGGQLNITKFALSDDEIDYDLWNPAHTLGTNYYGAVIENMPVLEGLPDETQMLRYKLVTLPKTAIGIPVIEVQPSAISFTSLTNVVLVNPSTINFPGANNNLGYTAVLSDDTIATLEVTQAVNTPTGQAIRVDTTQVGSVTTFLDDEATGTTTAGKSITRVGTQFRVTPVAQSDLTTVRRALLTIIGNETGGFKTISITLNPSNFLTQAVVQERGPLDQR
jgi:hypothetical protein